MTRITMQEMNWTFLEIFDKLNFSKFFAILSLILVCLIKPHKTNRTTFWSVSPSDVTSACSGALEAVWHFVWQIPSPLLPFLPLPSLALLLPFHFFIFPTPSPTLPLPLPSLRLLEYSSGVWVSTVSSSSGVWGGASVEIEFSAF